MNIDELRYPIGKFSPPEEITTNQIKKWIDEITLFPKRLNELVTGLSAEQLKQVYRPEGWNIQQLVHHCADSHMNAFIRFKLTLTEDVPTIKPYLENLWAEMPDTLDIHISESLKILEALHIRWTKLLKTVKETEWQREFMHPEYNSKIALSRNVGLYAWHCNHHLAHIKLALGLPIN